MTSPEAGEPSTVHGTATVSISGSPTQVVRIVGEVDLANAFDVDKQVSQAHEPELERVVVDLSGTDYIDSAGLAMLVRISARLAAARTPMTVVAPRGSAAHRVITLSGLASELGLPSEDGPAG